MEQSRYVIWKHKAIPNACLLDRLKGVERDYELQDGVSRQGTFQNAQYTMDPDHPYDTVLVDSLRNTSQLLVGSKVLKEFLECRPLSKVEYLPVTIFDIKGRPIREEYYIIHPIDPVDCLDIENCGVTWSEILDDIVDEVERLIIDEKKIDINRELFRPKYYSDIVLVNRELAEEIDKKRFTGIRWLELENYPED